MLLKRYITYAPFAFILHPRWLNIASCTPDKLNYRERIEQLNKIDESHKIRKYKEELSKTFGHSQVVSTLKEDMIDDLHYILVMYSKPLRVEQRISLRHRILKHLENPNHDAQKLLEYMMKYYEVL
jgi:hypothetical protein